MLTWLLVSLLVPKRKAKQANKEVSKWVGVLRPVSQCGYIRVIAKKQKNIFIDQFNVLVFSFDSSEPVGDRGRTQRQRDLQQLFQRGSHGAVLDHSGRGAHHQQDEDQQVQAWQPHTDHPEHSQVRPGRVPLYTASPQYATDDAGSFFGPVRLQGSRGCCGLPGCRQWVISVQFSSKYCTVHCSCSNWTEMFLCSRQLCHSK